MILAAGRGQRLRPLTDSTPKALLEVAGRPLLEHHVLHLVAGGITELVINLGWLGERIEARLGNGAALGAAIRYSREGAHLLDTGGGIRQALPLLGTAPFLLLNADAWFCPPPDFARLVLPADCDAHLLLAPNPAHHAEGDFALARGRLRLHGSPRYTYSGAGLLHPVLFAAQPPGPAAFPLAPLLHRAAAAGRLSGEVLTQDWIDVGAMERLRQARARAR